MKLIVKVKKIKGHCPVYKVGDEFIIEDGYKLKSNSALCMHSLVSIFPYYVALSKGVSPKDLGLSKDNKKAYVQCLDPCEYTGGGTVIFEILRED
jgi:uncharacterized repeat protein (TIGR04076 family)